MLQECRLNVDDNETRAFFHRGTTADTEVIRQIFQDQEYALKRLGRRNELRNIYHEIIRGGSTPLIMDLGGNIGASVVWFALKYPQSHIVSFEPEIDNFSLMKRNTRGLNVELHNAAIGSNTGKVRVVDVGAGEWGYRTTPDPQGQLLLCSMSDVVSSKVSEGFRPFIAKIDIEGGEKDLFEKSNNWVDLFPLLIIELHDWLYPREGTSHSFLKCIASRDRDFIYIGENIFSIRNS